MLKAISMVFKDLKAKQSNEHSTQK